MMMTISYNNKYVFVFKELGRTHTIFFWACLRDVV